MSHLPPNLNRRRPTASITMQIPTLKTPEQPITGLREFELHGGVLMKRFRLLLPLLSSLTKLVLKTSHGKCSETKSWNETINISTIFLNCPQLEDLYIAAGRQELLQGPWYPSVSLYAFTSSPLRSLVLENDIAQQKDLENLLTFTQRIKSLQCISLNIRGNNGASVEQFDVKQLHSCLLLLNIHLDSFFVSTMDTKFMVAVCPSSQKRAFCGTDPTPQHMQSIFSTNPITSPLWRFTAAPMSNPHLGTSYTTICVLRHISVTSRLLRCRTRSNTWTFTGNYLLLIFLRRVITPPRLSIFQESGSVAS